MHSITESIPTECMQDKILVKFPTCIENGAQKMQNVSEEIGNVLYLSTALHYVNNRAISSIRCLDGISALKQGSPSAAFLLSPRR